MGDNYYRASSVLLSDYVSKSGIGGTGTERSAGCYTTTNAFAFTVPALDNEISRGRGFGRKCVIERGILARLRLKPVTGEKAGWAACK